MPARADECGAALPAGTRAVYERSSRTVRCLECPGESATTVAPECRRRRRSRRPRAPTAQPSLRDHRASSGETSGPAGGSARREFERRRDARERRVRERHPRIGGFLLAVTEEPQSTRAWDTGAEGEQVRRRPSRRASWVTTSPCCTTGASRGRGPTSTTSSSRATAVFVVDAKKYQGTPALRVEGGLFRPRTEKLARRWTGLHDSSSTACSSRSTSSARPSTTRPSP